MGAQEPTKGRTAAAPPPKPVYKPKNQNLQTKCVYFYRVTPSGTADPIVDAYRYISPGPEYISYNSLPDLIADLTARARSGQINPLSQGVGSIVWQRKSFIAVVLDDTNDDLVVDDAMQFNKGEHTFRDGNDIRLPQLNNISAFYCINHMKKAHPNDPDLVEGEREFFEVCIRTRLYGPCHGRPRAHYETGTNQGPPLP